MFLCVFLDFYLPELNKGIECQGVQHFIPIKGNVEKFKKIQYNDEKKQQCCLEHNIPILYFSDKTICENYTDENIIYDLDKLLIELKDVAI